MLFILIALPIASAAALETTPSEWNGYERLDFTIAGKPGLIVKPKTTAAGGPWIWRTEFFGHEPQADLALLAKGWHLGYFQISDQYGAPPAIALMEQYHTAVTGAFPLNSRVVLEGFSRGGLYAVNFAAAHPDLTAGLYLDAPVLNLRSWPGGKGSGQGSVECWEQALAIYQLTEESSQDFRGNPLDHADELAEAKIPVIAVCGDSDRVVPYAENTLLFEERYHAAGGVIEVILKPGVDHHPHSLVDPTPIVDFLLSKAILAPAP